MFCLIPNFSLLMATGTSIESNIIALHLGHVPYTEIAGRRHIGQTRISRIFRHFHQSGIVPDALCISPLRKMQSDLVVFIEGEQSSGEEEESTD
jgi:hypothetical protein